MRKAVTKNRTTSDYPLPVPAAAAERLADYKGEFTTIWTEIF